MKIAILILVCRTVQAPGRTGANGKSRADSAGFDNDKVAASKLALVSIVASSPRTIAVRERRVTESPATLRMVVLVVLEVLLIVV